MPVFAQKQVRGPYVLKKDAEEYRDDVARRKALEEADDGASTAREPVEKPTVFHLEPLSAMQSSLITDGLTAADTGTGKVDVNIGTNHLEILRCGLVGWELFPFEDGAFAEFKTRSRPNRYGQGKQIVPTDETIMMIPASAQSELVNAITEGSRVTVEELGN